MKVTVTDPLSGVINSSQTFQVTIRCTQSISLVTNLISSTVTYLIDPNTLVTTTLTLPTYSPSPSSCAYGPLSY